MQKLEGQQEKTRQHPPEPRKPYTKPAILRELELETRAGTPLGIPVPMDPFGLDPQEYR